MFLFLLLALMSTLSYADDLKAKAAKAVGKRKSGHHSYKLHFFEKEIKGKFVPCTNLAGLSAHIIAKVAKIASKKVHTRCENKKYRGRSLTEGLEEIDIWFEIDGSLEELAEINNILENTTDEEWNALFANFPGIDMSSPEYIQLVIDPNSTTHCSKIQVENGAITSTTEEITVFFHGKYELQTPVLEVENEDGELVETPKYVQRSTDSNGDEVVKVFEYMMLGYGMNNWIFYEGDAAFSLFDNNPTTFMFPDGTADHPPNLLKDTPFPEQTWFYIPTDFLGGYNIDGLKITCEVTV